MAEIDWAHYTDWDHYTVIHLAVGPDKDGVTHSRNWEIPHEAIEQAAAMLTAAYGTPMESITSGERAGNVILYEEE